MTANDISAELRDRVAEAAAAGTPLCVRGGDTKAFYGRTPEGEALDLARHRGIASYEPTELVITARAGTPMRDLEAALADGGQMLAFEAPCFGPGATLGGTIACNLSGPRRPYAGAARDFVLGTKVLNGRGEVLEFGGQVMKNVAGYDVSRLMAGALGTLGVLLEASLKVLPRPEAEVTLRLTLGPSEALDQMQHWAARPLPVSATCHDGEALWLRLSGSAAGVAEARSLIGGDEDPAGDGFWHGLKEQEHPYFAPDRPLWRLSLPANAPPLDLPGEWLYEWGGAQRWLLTETDGQGVRAAAAAAGGHATRFRGHPQRDDVFQPLPPGLLAVHRNLKRAFDPQGILNPGRMYAEI